MRKAALIYNPASGRRQHLRLRHVEAAAAVLRAAGIAVTILPTVSAGSGGYQAGEAISSGHDVIFACGGDGTIHEVLQGMVAFGAHVPLGLIPLGTGNVLANDLGIPRDPQKAAQLQLTFTPRRIAAGHIEFQSQNGNRDSRYFTVMAGVGVDALMLHRATAEMKRQFGMLAYVYQMLRIALSHPYEEFGLEITGEQGRRTLAVSQATAVRITHFGNFMRSFAPDAALVRDDFQSVLISTPSRLKGMLYMSGVFLRKKWDIVGIELAHTLALECSAKSGQKYAHGIYAQADGEFLGTLPVSIRIVPRAFTLLMPPA